MRLNDPDFVKGQFQSPGQVVPAPVRQLGGGVYGQFPVGLVMGNAGPKGFKGRMFLLGGSLSILNDNICVFEPLVDVAINFINFKGDVAPAVYLDVRFFHDL